MIFTVETMRALYDLLLTTPPFNTWDLPDSEDMKFRLGKNRTHFGWYDDGRRGTRKQHYKPVIVMSTRLVHSLASGIAFMAHEMIHIHQSKHMSGDKEHGPAFKKLADQVCKIHGFDRGLF